MFLSNTLNNQLIKTVATSQGDVVIQKSVGRWPVFCGISATDSLQSFMAYLGGCRGSFLACPQYFVWIFNSYLYFGAHCAMLTELTQQGLWAYIYWEVDVTPLSNAVS